jgi:hypothetical protein
VKFCVFLWQRIWRLGGIAVRFIGWRAASRPSECVSQSVSAVKASHESEILPICDFVLSMLEFKQLLLQFRYKIAGAFN